MRKAVLGSGLVVGLVMLVAGGLCEHRLVYGENRNPGSSELIALSSDGPEARQQVTVIDPKTRVMSVYHISHGDGTITLMSVRSIAADLLMDEYNTNSPLPRDIRAMLSNR